MNGIDGYPRPAAEHPPPGEGETRCTFLLDPLSSVDERENRMLELIPGRVEQVDGVNENFLAGTITKEGMKGCSYPCYRVALGPRGSTRRAVPPGTPPVMQFVPLGNRKLIAYNSKAPVVVYMPEDAKLKFRVWKGGEEWVAKPE